MDMRKEAVSLESLYWSKGRGEGCEIRGVDGTGVTLLLTGWTSER